MSIKFITTIAIFLLLLGLGCSNSTAADVTLESSTQIITTGESFKVDVFVTPDTAIAGLQFDLECDSSKIQIDSVSEGVFLSQNGILTFFSEGNIDNSAGTLSNVFGSIMGPSNVSNPESFASITMSVKEQATSTSTISLKNVIISDPSGNPIDVLTTDLTLTINEVPISVANAPSEVNESDLVSFSATGSYDPDGGVMSSYEWDFGDGTTASGSEVTHIYANNGIYIVILTVTDNEGTSTSDTLMVTVNNVAPVADAGPDQTANIGDEIYFSGSFNDSGSLDTHTISWDFGDGEIVEGTLTPAHTYFNKGVYNVILTITDDDGASTSDTVAITVSDTNTISIVTLESSTPIVTAGESFTVDVFVTPDTAIAGLQFDLECDSSKIQIDSVSEGVFLSQNGILTFFSEGNIDNSAGTLSNVFGSIMGPSNVSNPESFASITMSVKEQATSTSTISLKNVIISDPSGNPIDVLTTDLTLTINEVPISVANAPSEVNESDLVSFSATGSYDPDDGVLTSYEWDFGDGTTASGSEVAHVYANNGTYKVTLTVTDDEGTSTSDTLIVTVNNVPPTVSVTGDTINENGVATISGSISDPGTLNAFEVVIDWGDGTSPETFTSPAGTDAFSKTHQYPDDNPTDTPFDNYDVSVTVNSDDDGEGTATTTVTVNNVAPVADAGPDQTANMGDEISFSGNFDDPGSLDTHTISWNFGDGEIVEGTLTPAHTYAGSGVYNVILTITDDDGASTSDTVAITIDKAPGGPQEVFYDSFEDGLGKWTQDIQNDWRSSTAKANDVSYSAEVDGRATNAQLISELIPLPAGTTSATITFDWFIERGLDNGEYLAFDVSTDGGITWIKDLERLEGARKTGAYEHKWHDDVIVELGEDELNGINSFMIRFRGKMSSSREDAYVDDVKVIAY